MSRHLLPTKRRHRTKALQVRPHAKERQQTGRSADQQYLYVVVAQSAGPVGEQPERGYHGMYHMYCIVYRGAGLLVSAYTVVCFWWCVVAHCAICLYHCKLI